MKKIRLAAAVVCLISQAAFAHAFLEKKHAKFAADNVRSPTVNPAIIGILRLAHALPGFY